MALDEPNDHDQVFEIDGFKYIVNKEFMDKISPIKIDFALYGFKLDCGVDFSAGCNSCSTEGSCCST